MIKDIFTAALGMQSQVTRLEVTANNIANATTAGFKRQSVFEKDLIQAGNNFFNNEGDVEQGDTPTGQYSDFSAGPMQHTANPLDFAIEGKGFFTLTDEEGATYLTKAGNFRLSETGEIISMDGKHLMGENGPLNVSKELLSGMNKSDDKAPKILRIAQSGEVYVNEFEVGKISIVEPADYKSLERTSHSQFKTAEDMELKPLEGSAINVRQSWLEGSNVNIVQEMVQMIELQRMYDAGSKVIQTADHTLEKSLILGRYV